jgi:hypothetical protein
MVVIQICLIQRPTKHAWLNDCNVWPLRWTSFHHTTDYSTFRMISSIKTVPKRLESQVEYVTLWLYDLGPFGLTMWRTPVNPKSLIKSSKLFPPSWNTQQNFLIVFSPRTRDFCFVIKRKENVTVGGEETGVQGFLSRNPNHNPKTRLLLSTL